MLADTFITKWSDIDLDAGEWRYLVSKTNTDHLVPLSTQAIEILRTIHPLSGHGEFVFQNRKTVGQLVLAT